VHARSEASLNEAAKCNREVGWPTFSMALLEIPQRSR